MAPTSTPMKLVEGGQGGRGRNGRGEEKKKRGKSKTDHQGNGYRLVTGCGL
jgi:hypothetical protein